MTQRDDSRVATHVRCVVTDFLGAVEEIAVLELPGGPLPGLAGYKVDFRHDQIRGADQVRIEFTEGTG